MDLGDFDGLHHMKSLKNLWIHVDLGMIDLIEAAIRTQLEQSVCVYIMDGYATDIKMINMSHMEVRNDNQSNAVNFINSSARDEQFRVGIKAICQLIVITVVVLAVAILLLMVFAFNF